MQRLIPHNAQAYDSHCNLVLGEVEETIYAVDDEDETVSRKSEMLFVRGWKPRRLMPPKKLYLNADDDL